MSDATWLRGLGEEGLTALLARRPEATTTVPASLAELATNLDRPSPVLAALRRLDLPTLQVAEALAACGGAADRETIYSLLGVPAVAKADDVDRALAVLCDHGLVTAGPRPSLVAAAIAAWASPLGLGPPARGLVDWQPSGDLKQICTRLGVAPPARREQVIEALLSALGDRARIAAVVDAAPEPARKLLHLLAMEGGQVSDYAYVTAGSDYRNSPLRWAAGRGLILRVNQFSNTYVMPAEVAMAMVGPELAVPFDAEPPHCPRAAADPIVVARDAAAAAGAFLRLTTAVLGEAGRSRIAALRYGGVGVRELKRLAKAHGAQVDQLKLVLAAAHAARLFSCEGAVLPTAHYDHWLAREPAERLASLVRAWWSMPYAPLGRADAAWSPSDEDNGTADMRACVLAEATATRGVAITDGDAFAELVLWRRPCLLLVNPAQARTIVDACWREAAMLGLVGAGAVSDAGHALLAEDWDPANRRALIVALTGVGEIVRTAHIQADLTAVVPGTPGHETSHLLDAVADRESTASASTWRFSQASVRRALDAGHTADELLEELAGIAAGTLPQTLEYLIRDVARRHGAIRVTTAMSCLRSDDTALVAEMAADRKLRSLGLRVLAPTVLAGAKPLDETLAALRAAGYAPIAEAADGTAVIEAAPPRRALMRRDRHEYDDMLERQAAARRAAAIGTPLPRSAMALAQLLLSRPDDHVDRRAGTPSGGMADFSPSGQLPLDAAMPDPERPRSVGPPPWARGRRR